MSTLNEVYNDKNMPWDIEQAAAQYHMEKDIEAMAARIDQLEAENAKLEQLLTDHKNWLRIANDQWSKAEDNLTNYMVKVALTPLTKEST